MFSKKIGLSLTGLLAVLVLFSCKSSGDKGVDSNGAVELKINFGKGDKYLYTTQVNQKIKTFGTEMNQGMLMEMIYADAGEEGGNKKLDITYDHIQITMASPMGQTKYDSKTPDQEDPEFGFMNKLIGKSFHIGVAPNGDIVSLTGLTELAGLLSESAGAETKAVIESQLNDTAVKMMMQNSFDMYPGKKVKPGDTWSKKSVMSFSGTSINVENTYTLKSVTDGKATVSILSVMELPSSKMEGMQMQMSGKQQGTMDIEVESGRIVSGKTTQSITGNISAGEQSLPMSIEGDITISSKKL